MLLSTTEIKQNRSQKCSDRQHALVIGASMGEVAAATVAGALTPRDGAAVVCRRSDLVGLLADRAPGALEPALRPDWAAAADDAARLRVVIDQVARLTDLSAAAWHSRLTGRR